MQEGTILLELREIKLFCMHMEAVTMMPHHHGNLMYTSPWQCDVHITVAI